jgi:hypothetical protein
MRRRFDHVDLRVHSLAEVRPFYEALLPALGFTRDVKIEGWLQYEAEGTDGATEFVGVTESPQHVANECRIAFWADSIREVDRLAAIAVQGAREMLKGQAMKTLTTTLSSSTILARVIQCAVKRRCVSHRCKSCLGSRRDTPVATKAARRVTDWLKLLGQGPHGWVGKSTGRNMREA